MVKVFISWFFLKKSILLCFEESYSLRPNSRIIETCWIVRFVSLVIWFHCAHQKPRNFLFALKSIEFIHIYMHHSHLFGVRIHIKSSVFFSLSKFSVCQCKFNFSNFNISPPPSQTQTHAHRLPNFVFNFKLLISFKHTSTSPSDIYNLMTKWVIKTYFFSFLLFFRIISFKTTTDRINLFT